MRDSISQEGGQQFAEKPGQGFRDKLQGRCGRCWASGTHDTVVVGVGAPCERGRSAGSGEESDPLSEQELDELLGVFHYGPPAWFLVLVSGILHLFCLPKL